MTIAWASFFAELASNPVLVAVTLLNVGVIVVNDATDATDANDAPNAMATVISTHIIKPPGGYSHDGYVQLLGTAAIMGVGAAKGAAAIMGAGAAKGAAAIMGVGEAKGMGAVT